MTLPNLTLAAKLGVGAVAALAVVGGGTAAGLHLAGGTSRATTPAPIVATPTPAGAQGAARTQQTAANRAIHQAVLQGEAQVLGITPKELGADLKQGTTVQQLATQKGISQQQFQAQLVQDVQPVLDKQVAAGTLTQAQEQQELKRLGRTIPNWMAPVKKPQPSATPTAAQ